MYGFLNIDKPAGWTSRDVVNKVARLARPAKAGHAGTLDPLATGVLVVAVGPATRLIPYVQRMRKRYRGEFLLGRSSLTEDVEGEVSLLEGAPIPNREKIFFAARSFVGTILQRPPAFSALNVGGRRAYELARAGREVELAPREVEVHAIEVVEYDYPRLALEVECGAGTYIRSLGRDLAESLGTSAVMSALVRTAVGSFVIGEALTIDEISQNALFCGLIRPEAALVELPRIELARDERVRIARGLSIERDVDSPRDELAAFDARGGLVAVLARRGPREWGPRLNLLPLEGADE